MALAFLHGEIIFGWLSMGALAVLIVPVIGLWWSRHPPRVPILPSVIYLVLAAVFFALWISDESSLLLSSLGFAFAVPWSAIYLFAILTLQVEIPIWVILPGFFVNAALIYFTAEFMRRRKLSRLGAG
jgi:hypothetical protein